MFFRSSTQIARIARPIATRGYADKSTPSAFPVPLAILTYRHLAAVAQKVGETVKKVAQSFSADGGAVGSKFRADGEVGQVGEQGTFFPGVSLLSTQSIN